MRALLLSGSGAEKSHTRALLAHLEGLLKEKGCKTEVWDLKTAPLPFVLAEYHKDPTEHPDKVVKDFVAAVERADLVVLGSPLYHGSYSGVLKNALDNLRKDAFRGKWIGLVGNASGLRASHVQFSHLRQVVNALIGYTVQTQVGTCRDDYEELQSEYVLRDPDMQERCKRLVDELVSLSRLQT